MKILSFLPAPPGALYVTMLSRKMVAMKVLFDDNLVEEGSSIFYECSVFVIQIFCSVVDENLFISNMLNGTNDL